MTQSGRAQQRRTIIDNLFAVCSALVLQLAYEQRRIKRLEEFNRQLALKCDEQRRALDARSK